MARDVAPLGAAPPAQPRQGISGLAGKAWDALILPQVRGGSDDGPGRVVALGLPERNCCDKERADFVAKAMCFAHICFWYKWILRITGAAAL